MFVCGVIPARGGSQGVPRKNIKLLGGKPLIAYAIEAGRLATRLNRILRLNDDPQIVRIAEPRGSYLANVGNHHLHIFRRQDAPVVYRENAAACTIRRDVIMERENYYFEPPDRVRYYVIPAERSVVIDTPLDFAFAEFLVQ